MKASRPKFKEHLKYHRVIAICIVVSGIWFQYEFNSSKLTHPNGRQKIEGSKQNGKDEGLWTWFYPNGKIQMQGNFLNGNREGTWTLWDSTGTKINERNYTADKLNGPFSKWSVNGKLISKGIYKNDSIEQEIFY